MPEVTELIAPEGGAAVWSNISVPPFTFIEPRLGVPMGALGVVGIAGCGKVTPFALSGPGFHDAPELVPYVGFAPDHLPELFGTVPF